MPLCNRVSSDAQQVYAVCAERQSRAIGIKWSLSYMAGDGKSVALAKRRPQSERQHNRTRFFVSLNCLF